MKTNDEIRRDNLLIAIKKYRTATALADAAGTSAAYLSQIKRQTPDSKTGKPKGMGDEVARNIERAIGVQEGWMDAEHNSSHHDASITAPEEGVITESAVKRENTMGFSNIEPGPDVKGILPLISWVQAGNWEAIVDNFAPGDAEEWRPSIIASHGHGFFLRVRGESMYNPDGEPSFRHNDIIQVEPARWADNGSLVIVRLDDEKEATFKQLIIEGEKKYLKALNPSWPERIMQVNGNATICGVVRAKVVTYG